MARFSLKEMIQKTKATTGSNSASATEEVKQAVKDFQAAKDEAVKNTAKNTRKGMPTQDEIDKMAESIMDDVIREEFAKEGTGNPQADQFINDTDEEVNKVKLSFFKVLDTMKRISGLSDIVVNIQKVLVSMDEAEEADKSAWEQATKEIHQMIDTEVQEMKALGNDEAAEVLVFIKEEANIFEMFFVGISLICCFVSKHLASLGLKIAQSKMLGSILKGVGAIASVMLKGVKLAFHGLYVAGSWMASAVLATVLHVGRAVYRAIMYAVLKAQEKKLDKEEPDDDSVSAEEEDTEDTEYYEEDGYYSYWGI